MNLSLERVCKTYSSGVMALDHISLELSPGMTGLLGPNGAGKSTLMRTVATLQAPDSGRITFNQRDIYADKTGFRKKLGYLPQTFGVYPKETAHELLHYFAILKGLTSRYERSRMVDHVLELTNLWDVRHQRVSTFSGGMKQRFGIAQLLLNRPEVIIVDEPTAGLDPAERTRFLNLLRQIGTDRIVIFSTHLVDDVQELCKDMAIMNSGKLLAHIDPAAAIRQLNGKIWETISELTSPGASVLKLSDRYNEQHQLVNRVYSDSRPSGPFQPADPKLEDYYFFMLNRESL